MMLDHFLRAGLNYKAGSRQIGMSPASFRNRILAELEMLGRRFDLSFHPLRAAHLRLQEDRIRELLELYRKQEATPLVAVLGYEDIYENCDP